MSQLQKPTAPILLRAFCEAAHGSFAVEIDRLTPEGCTAEAPAEWSGDLDFLRLTLAGQAEINGRVVQHDGKRAEIRFFGQIHPLVIENWRQRAA